MVVLRKLLSNFHRKFANLEKPRFLLASVNGPTVATHTQQTNFSQNEIAIMINNHKSGYQTVDLQCLHISIHKGKVCIQICIGVYGIWSGRGGGFPNGWDPGASPNGFKLRALNNLG